MSSNAIPEYKEIANEVCNYSTDFYVVLSLTVITFTELLAVSVIHVFFCQDKGLCKATIWACDNWYAEISISGIHILTQICFTLGNEEDSLVDFLNAACWLGLVILMIWYVRWMSVWIGFAEFFFGNLILFIYIFDILCNVTMAFS